MTDSDPEHIKGTHQEKSLRGLREPYRKQYNNTRIRRNCKLHYEAEAGIEQESYGNHYDEARVTLKLLRGLRKDM